jgi:DNA-binding MarR family transcriptional regulator
LAVAERLNFRHAANALGVTQSSVSARIKALEETVGVLLFERRHRGVRLTDAGRRFVAEVSAEGRSTSVFTVPSHRVSLLIFAADSGPAIRQSSKLSSKADHRKQSPLFAKASWTSPLSSARVIAP